VPRYLFTSVSSARGGIWLFDSESGSTQRLVDGHFRGITLGPDGRWWAVSGRRHKSRAHRTRLIALTPETWQVEDRGELPYRGCHDLRWTGDAFYLAASFGNRLVRLDENGRETGVFQLVETNEDVCHLNSIAMLDGELYCTVFSLEPGTRGQKRGTPAWHSAGMVLRIDFDARRYDICVRDLEQPHSLNATDDGLLLVESHAASITRARPNQARSERVALHKGFVRGLALREDEWVAGVCTFQREEEPDSALERLAARVRSPWRPFEGLMTLEPGTGVLRQRFPLPESDIYDVVTL
jgi:hypothetical protein